MPGVDLDELPFTPCPYCRQKVSALYGVLIDGRWYHEKCSIYKFSQEIEKLEKKAKRGSITLEEAEDLKELKIIYINLKTPKKDIDISKYKESPKFFGNTKIGLLPKTNKSKKMLKTQENTLLEQPKNML